MSNFTKFANTHLHSEPGKRSSTTFWVLVGSAVAVASLAAFRLVNMDNTSLHGTNPEWIADWIVVWVSLAVASLPLALPVFSAVRHHLDRNDQEQALKDMMALSPGMRQEMAAMAARDTSEESSQDGAALNSALQALGGLTIEGTGRKATLETAFGLAKRPLIAYL
jgi:hypothetical protein